MTYTLTASNIDKVSAAYIHLAPRGEDGPVVVDLRVLASCAVEGTSISCRGAFTSARLEEMRGGRTYVNVHTIDFSDVRFGARSGLPVPRKTAAEDARERDDGGLGR